MISVQVALLQAQGRLIERLERLAPRVAADEEGCWSAYCEAASALAAIAPVIAPGAGGQMLTTEQLAERLQISPKTLLRRAKKGQVQPLRLAARGRGALRWPAEAGR